MSIIRARTVARCMYSTRILDGWRINDKQIEKTALRLSHIRSETGKVPGLAVLRFGYNAEAERFIERKKDIALTCGINLQDIVFDASCKTEEVQEKIRSRNERDLSPDNVAAYIDRALGTGTKRDASMVETMKKNYVQDNRVAMYDPLDTYNKAQEALKRLEEFKRELHFKLNQANVNTQVTVEYED